MPSDTRTWVSTYSFRKPRSPQKKKKKPKRTALPRDAFKVTRKQLILDRDFERSSSKPVSMFSALHFFVKRIPSMAFWSPDQSNLFFRASYPSIQHSLTAKEQMFAIVRQLADKNDEHQFFERGSQNSFHSSLTTGLLCERSSLHNKAQVSYMKSWATTSFTKSWTNK